MVGRLTRRAAPRTRPLGVDIGATRVRVALLEERDGQAELVAVAVRERDADPAAAMRDAVAELGTRETRCVFGLTEPDGLVRTGTFPKAMSASERERSARFEAARYVDYPVSGAVVRIVPTPTPGDFVIGVARRTSLETVAAIAKRLRLRVHAVDHTAFALRRVFTATDCIIDVGAAGATAYVYGARIPIVQRFDAGGRAITEAIRDALGVDFESAERRKRTIGLAGAGEYARDLLVEAIATMFVDVRASGAADVTGVTLIGNGARLDGLAPAIERVTAVPARLGQLAVPRAATIPADVVRAATPDWAAAVGLALWEAA